MLNLRQVIGVGLFVAACGCGGGGGGQVYTVSAMNVDGIGRVLVDASGDALYSPDEEAGGTVLCVDLCTSFWKPLDPGPGSPTAAPGTTTLGVVVRPDGGKQLTASGRPLYTFVQDSPASVTGNGFMDAFGSQHFTWHVIVPDGATAGSVDGGGGSAGGGGGIGGYGGYGY
ncbi:MAG TPA: hypothetical protein VF334_15365 [Polyangia bacterium]